MPPEGEGQPYEYVYQPSYGWAWVVAPWVWGLGPWPFFGAIGPARLGWFAHGFWRSPWRWHLRPVPFGGRFAFHPLRPAPFGRAFAGRGLASGRGFVGAGRFGRGGGGHGGHR